MIECRRLKKSELKSLLITAPDSETRNLKKYLKENNISAYDFFEEFAVDQSGICSSRPVYFAALTKSVKGTYEFWTIVNKDIKEIFSLCKISKRILKKWSKQYGSLYATMEKENPKNIEWVYWLGFKKIDENERMITFCYKEGG